MGIEETYYLLGSIFFALNFVLLIILIIGTIYILRSLRKLQQIAEERLEKKSVILEALSYLPLMLLESMRLWKRRKY